MLKIEPWNILFIAINLIVLYVFMRLVFVNPLKNIIEKREDIIKSGLKNAAESEKNAKAMEQEWTEKIQSVKDESVHLMAKAREDANVEYERLVANANEEAAHIVENARKDIKNEYNKTMQDLQSQIADIAMDATKKVLETSDLNNINSSLYEQFLTEKGDGNDSNGN